MVWLIISIINMIDNQYFLVKKLGRGGSSDVYLAKDEFDNEFAIKIIRKSKENQNSNSTCELQKEFFVMEMLNKHPNILKCHNFVYDGDLCVDGLTAKIKYNVLESCSNGTLSSFIRRNGSIPEQFVRFLAHQMSSTILFLHESRIVHLDIKPQNVLLDEYFNTKLADFGSCEADISCTGMWDRRKGTPKYMAPEVEDFSNPHPYDMYAADVYSLGVTIYVMLTGKTPNHNTPICDQSSTNWIDAVDENSEGSRLLSKGNLFDYGYSEELVSLLESMINHDPAKRPNMSEVWNHSWFTLDYLDVSPEEVYRFARDI